MGWQDAPLVKSAEKAQSWQDAPVVESEAPNAKPPRRSLPFKDAERPVSEEEWQAAQIAKDRPINRAIAGGLEIGLGLAAGGPVFRGLRAVAPRLARVAMSPATWGAAGGAKAASEGSGPLGIVEGAGSALLARAGLRSPGATKAAEKVVGMVSPTAAKLLAVRSQLAHALGRAVKAEPAIAGKVAPLVEKVAPAASQAAGGGISSAAAELGRRGGMASGVARKAASEARKGAEAARRALTPAQAGANAIEQKIVEAHAQGMSPGQIRDTLRQQFGIKDSVGAQMVGMVQQAYSLKPHVMR